MTCLPASQNEASAKLAVKPRRIPTSGLIMSVTNEETTLEMAPPKMNPTAKPITPCSLIKLRNPRMLTLYHPICAIMTTSYLCVHTFPKR